MLLVKPMMVTGHQTFKQAHPSKSFSTWGSPHCHIIVDLLVENWQHPIVYHSQVQSCQDCYWDWYNGKHSILISTSGLYHGIDHSAVVAAVFHDFPETIVEFVQASGQVARGIKFGVSHVVIPMKQHRFAFGEPECQQLLPSLTMHFADQCCW
jgi:hypothetical protein